MIKCPKCGQEAEHILPDQTRLSKFYKNAFWWLVIGCLIPVGGWVVALITVIMLAKRSQEC